MRDPRETGIIMQAESVLAILATPPTKSQTRRVAEVSPEIARQVDEGGRAVVGAGGFGGIVRQVAGGEYTVPVRCPYGGAGDHLWVREAHAYADAIADEVERDPPNVIWYGADRMALLLGTAHERPRKLDARTWNTEAARWRPGRWMTRANARLVLTITEVRLERLHAITEADAQAEGIERPTCPHPDCTQGGCASSRFRPEYARRWDLINAKRKGGRYAWARDPWVWAIAFTTARRWERA